MKWLMSTTPSNLMCFLFPVSGVRWSNINESIDNSSMGQVLLMLLVDTLIFALLAWYLDKVGSGRVGEKPGPTTGKGGKQHITTHNYLLPAGICIKKKVQQFVCFRWLVETRFEVKTIDPCRVLPFDFLYVERLRSPTFKGNSSFPPLHFTEEKEVLVVGFGTRQPWYFPCSKRFWSPDTSAMSQALQLWGVVGGWYIGGFRGFGMFACVVNCKSYVGCFGRGWRWCSCGCLNSARRSCATLRMDLTTCSPAMPGNSFLGRFKSFCKEYLLFFWCLSSRSYGSYLSCRWMSHILLVCKEFLCLDTNKETTYAFYKSFRVWNDDVGHGECVSGLPCGVGTKQFPSRWPHSVAS